MWRISNVQVATFAGGCFWGLELAFQRVPGVTGTAVGYTHGDTEAVRAAHTRSVDSHCYGHCACTASSAPSFTLIILPTTTSRLLTTWSKLFFRQKSDCVQSVLF